MAKAKVISISRPVNAKHVSGFSVSANTQTSSIDSYFDDITIQPDARPSHTFVALGKTEVPHRSDAIVNKIRKPSVSLRRSISRLSRRSVSHVPELHHKSATLPHARTSPARSESTDVHRSLKMQSSMSRLRQRVGLDKDVHQSFPVPKPTMPEVEKVPEPIAKDEPFLKTRMSMPRMSSGPSCGSAERSTSAPPPSPRSHTVQQKALVVARQPSNGSYMSPESTPSAPFRSIQSQSIQHGASVVARQPSATRRRPVSIERKPSPPLPTHTSPPPPPQKPLARPKRADSGTAVGFYCFPVDIRPLGFREILAMKSHSDRMESYQKAREYWAHADHGLAAWAEGTRGARVLTSLA